MIPRTITEYVYIVSILTKWCSDVRKGSECPFEVIIEQL